MLFKVEIDHEGVGLPVVVVVLDVVAGAGTVVVAAIVEVVTGMSALTVARVADAAQDLSSTLWTTDWSAPKSETKK